MNGVVPILNQQLAEAQAQGDRPRQIALSVALLKERVSDHGRILAIISEGCVALAQENLPGDLSAALGWYQTWHRHCRSPEAKAGLEAIQERITRVEDAERLVQDATTARDGAALRTALAYFVANADRLPSTQPLIAEGQAVLDSLVQAARRSWSERITRTGVLRERIAKAVPGSLDLAMKAWLELVELDQSVAEDPSLADLQERAEAARNRHRLLDSALRAAALRPLEEAHQAVLTSSDRLSDSTLLLDRALVAQSERRARLEQLHGELAALDRRRLDLCLPVREELAQIDPSGPAAAGLERDRAQATQLQAWHAIIAEAEERPLTELEAAVDGLDSTSEQLSDSPAVLARGRNVLAHRRAQISARIRRQRLAIGSIVAVVLTVIVLIARDVRGYAAIGEATSAEAALAAALSYRDGFHFLNHDAASAAVTRLQDDVMVTRLRALEAITDPTVRLREIDALLAGDVAKRRDELTTMREHARLELADRAFGEAMSMVDPQRRIVALEAYAATVGDAGRAKAARDAIARTQRERDLLAWAAVESATNADQRLGAITAYLALPDPVRAEEAKRLRATVVAEQERARARAEDDAVWAAAAQIAEPVAAIAAIEGYLARSAPVHADEARSRLAKALVQRDEVTWTLAQAPGPVTERLARLRAYRSGPAPRRHDAEADSQIEVLVWELAKAPADPQQRLTSVRAYLADPLNTAFRTEADAEVSSLLEQFDRAAFERARAVEDPRARIAALRDYQQVPGANQQQPALEEIARAARALIERDPALVVALPRPVLDRIPVTDLVRLPLAHFNRLPATLRARLPQAPKWASSSGVDDYGCWAVLNIGEQVLRFRYVVEGQCQVMTSNGMEVVANPAPCWMGETECTQALWSEIQRSFFSDGNPSRHRGLDLPVHNLSRTDCQRFIASCNARLAKDGVAAQVTLPTAAQWRFVASTGVDGLLALERGSARVYDTRELVRLAYARENGQQPASVGGSRRDRWGLADLLGNVGEWCIDDVDGNAHWRGGTWTTPRAECLPDRVAVAKPDEELETVGLRLVVVGTTQAP